MNNYRVRFWTSPLKYKEIPCIDQADAEDVRAFLEKKNVRANVIRVESFEVYELERQG